MDPVDADPDLKHYFKVLPEIGNEDIEMEFFNISLTKDSSFLLHAIHSLFCWRRKPYSSCKKAAKQEKSKSIL